MASSTQSPYHTLPSHGGAASPPWRRRGRVSGGMRRGLLLFFIVSTGIVANFYCSAGIVANLYCSAEIVDHFYWLKGAVRERTEM